MGGGSLRHVYPLKLFRTSPGALDFHGSTFSVCSKLNVCLSQDQYFVTECLGL